jgi:hypothetical protein
VTPDAILFTSANPVGSSPLTVSVDAREIAEGVGHPAFLTTFAVRTAHCGTPSELREALDRFRPTVLHFLGHGTTDGLFFSGPDALPRLVGTAEAAQVFKGLTTPVRLVVLSACYNPAQMDVLCRYGEAVVAIEGSFSDAATRVFSSVLYMHLADGCPIPFAFEQARTAVSVSSPGDAADRTHLRVREGISPRAVVFPTARPSSS